MLKLRVDNKEIDVEPGTTVLEAARISGTEVPAMCFADGLGHFTSCMVCLVKDGKSGKLFPSCSVTAEEGMEVVTADPEVMEARKTALELLLSDHVGDCEAPCQISCPAHMDIPRMNRLLEAGKFQEAAGVVMKDIALPTVLGYICSAPCEGACRRRPIDGAVSICMLKRFTGYKSLEVEIGSESGTVAIIGSGPAGLAAAYYLRLRGYHTILFEKEAEAGGALRQIPDDQLPKAALELDINRILSTGIELHLSHPVNPDSFGEFCKKYSAVVIAGGEELLGIEKSHQIDNLFVVGNARKISKMAVRAAGQGKEVAFSIDQYLAGKPVTGEPRMFNSRFGRLVVEEYQEYLKESAGGARTEPDSGFLKGFSEEEVIAEAARCLHCDCRKMDHCSLRILSDQYQADQKRFKGEERKPVTKNFQHGNVVYEPQKCIKCGICVRITAKHKEEYGMTFIGRGFDVVIEVPFNESLEAGLRHTAGEAADGCPTGALSRKVKKGASNEK